MTTEFSDNLRNALAELGQTQSWLGAEIARIEGMESPTAQSHVARYLSGAMTPNPPRVFTIEKALGLRPGALSRHLGYVPAETVPAVTVPEAAAEDLELTQTQREDLVALWEGMRARTRARRG